MILLFLRFVFLTQNLLDACKIEDDLVPGAQSKISPWESFELSNDLEPSAKRVTELLISLKLWWLSVSVGPISFLSYPMVDNLLCPSYRKALYALQCGWPQAAAEWLYYWQKTDELSKLQTKCLAHSMLSWQYTFVKLWLETKYAKTYFMLKNKYGIPSYLPLKQVVAISDWKELRTFHTCVHNSCIDAITITLG